MRHHLNGKKLCDNVHALENQQTISSIYPPATDPMHAKVTRAEVKVSAILAHRNVPLAVADHWSPLFKDILLTVKEPRHMHVHVPKQLVL